MSTFWKRVILILAGAALMVLLSACGKGATTASCAFVAGTGQSGFDAKLHQIIYPGQSIPNRSGEKVTYVPCNSRNYIINDGTVKNANGELVGDRGQLITATTSTGVTVTVAARALWTLNQSEAAMRLFYTVCFKYTCASDSDVGGTANFSSKGWNGMLAENFGTAMDTAARTAAAKVDDSIWKKRDPEQFKKLGDEMSNHFSDAVRANLGFNTDLFCGSGNSQWTNPDKPGEGEFTCYPVRIIVDDVQVLKSRADESSEGVTAINEQTRKNAEALYGPNAGDWLGLHTAIDKCKTSGTTCVINIGGNGGTAVPVPQISPSPTSR